MRPEVRIMPVISSTIALFLCVAAACPSLAGRFTDTFSTSPTDLGRKPFLWDRYYSPPEPEGVWSCADGVLTYRAQEEKGTGSNVLLETAGIDLNDATDWSLEIGFRHVSGVAPRPEYEVLAYITWFADAPGEMRIVALMYDPEQQAIIPLNGGRKGTPIEADLSGDFHSVRMTVSSGDLQVYVDGEAVGEPIHLVTRAYFQDESIHIGPITSTDPHSLHFEFDYLALTDEGAIAPGEDDTWKPAEDAEAVAKGLSVVQQPELFDHPPYPGITLISREKGGARWSAAIPEAWHKLSAIISKEPRTLDLPMYTYPDGKTAQNIYRSQRALVYDENRCVAVSHLTRGIDDTAAGFIDYKLWYRVSTDGGNTYGEEKPIVEEGDDYSPMHPLKYVWIGKNGYCYAAIPPFLKMSNGEILLPIYHAPLDENGSYYNPLGAFTFTYVAALIGRWNDAGDDVIWNVSDEVRLTGEQSSRGANECAVIELSKPGHILLVIRGSNQNDKTGKIPPVKWKTLSTDYGRTWSECTPFTYTDGAEFMSPSACSAFIRSSKTGKVYWVGNISRTLPRGNSPRYPLIIGELDEETLSLRKQTATIIDDRLATDPTDMQLSNFGIVEDPGTGHIVLYMSRYMSPGHKDNPGYGRHTYVIEVK